MPYTSEVTTLPIEAELKTGPTMFETKRVSGLNVRCRNSAGGSYGPDGDNQAVLMKNNALYSGDIVNLSLRGGHKTVATVTIKQSEPLPLNIDAIGLEVEVE
jgi:hypothetical protein